MKLKVKTLALFLLALLLPMSLFSYEISFSKKFSKSVTPDLLSTYISISVEDKSEKFINKHIEIFNKYIKNNDDVNKYDGSFTLSPKYKYFKNTQEFIGYVGNLRYIIKSKNASSLNKFINDLIEMESKYNRQNIKINISNVSWTTSTKLYDNSLDALRINAMTWIEKYSASLKNILLKDCEVKSIDIDKTSKKFTKNINMETYSSKRVSNIAPDNSTKEIKIDAVFLLECK
ncbi:SIMPL domain-containing protein [Poseidonibacter ostreae]|uniref:DUF541 domain-containing protein n=1 Tax=Poseidonibacter ostreae TaxID=2654171 RepID=A0A6L4WTA6_9BACT|nr:SIMPL domain-containing protein [Poseidonibacter ostreae]KAB7887710.1 DUF541 domain-containing protein [Poseidonibacter ostreae]KAB7889268.1 DUF541 domain-containing protein [Poseidonibacter ostreae]KAB7892113.1 DUF541 domain-containing protein [Poseidonibacter ostreae]